MQQTLDRILEDALNQLQQVQDSAALSALEIAVLGKNGSLTLLLRKLGTLPAAERPQMGKLINDARKTFEAQLDARKQRINAQEAERQYDAEWLDVTAPGVQRPLGRLHPVTQTYMTIRDVFIGLGFVVEEGPEIEREDYNFDMLNILKGHPSRDMHDTFYTGADTVLRTHTSPVQVRAMLAKKPPIRMVCPGRVYRADRVDATHSPVFHQLEGLVVDQGISMQHLKGVLDLFAKSLYGSETRTRFRPSYFPFTEPSAEMDVSCSICSGEGCRVCKNTGWIEILGCGMVHPNVLRNCGIDPREYSGFAFGMGLDRITNMKYGISDIRLLFENDLRFLRQF